MELPFLWVVQFIFIPIIGVLFWLVFKHKAEADKQIETAKAAAAAAVAAAQKEQTEHRRASDMQILALGGDLNMFKLQVTREYAPNSYLRDVESKLLSEIRGLGAKLDKINDWMVENARSSS